MKKIILVFESIHYNNESFDFIEALRKIEDIFVTAVFLSPVDYTSVWAFPVVPGTSGLPVTPGSPESEELLQKHMASFKAKCAELNIPFAVHNDVNGVVFEQVRLESRFADLMFIHTGLFYAAFGEQPNDYLKEVMHIAECPVVLIPPRGTLPQSIVLMYDGSESSMFAIRQFAYIFPVLKSLTSTLIYVDHKSDEIPDQSKLKEWMYSWYPNIQFEIMRDEKNYHSWFQNHPNPFIVTGSYGRAAIVEFLKKSFLTDIINDQQYFVFLAHK